MKLEIIESKDDYTSIKIPDNCEVTVKDGLINIEKSIQNGDFVFIETYYCNVIAIFKSHRDDKSIYYHSCICYPEESCSIAYNDWCAVKKIRKATEEEKGILTNAMYEKGYEWDFKNEKIVKINHFWQPSIGEHYYFISSDLTLVRNMYRDSGFDRILQKNGSCFKTTEAAENCLEEIKKIYKKINTI